ncbi:carboxypeptidase-like regulatory domain-containing protein [Flagellimonas myxillae]|uniref:carboxypeptidase-like regulatory domain-containing protein n=1 Tax=Flagellimonas myxillae TaxID=2942214 RepID=UPI00201F39CB|nr:carboxypeptidase-like regulatory domain-containing protein [Muricauda myxillae]MCL6267027.1 carboxypeptidase-like regulatory domain-containing protein [Muricauda myxillae]
MGSPKSVLFVVLGLWFCHIHSQEISGFVSDSKTKEPIMGASVYYDGSSVGTITDADGLFKITQLAGSSATLVIRHLGYQTRRLDQPWETGVLQISLKEEAENLDEIIVTADPFTRKQKMRVFRVEFLGDTPGGKNSKIINEHDIRLFFNTYNNTLSAYSDKPIVIQNDYLGYRVSFDIQEFKIYFRSTSLERINNIINTLYNGSTLFFDVSRGNQKILRRRHRAYEGSRMHFMRSCWQGNLKSQKFKIAKRFRDISASEFFSVEADSQKDLKNIKFLGERFVIYHKRKGYYRSTLLIQKSETIFSIDRYGHCSPFKELVFGGYMADFRIGDMLPIDYGL